MPKKDFSQVAFDVVRKATGEVPKHLPKPQKETAPKVNKGADSAAAVKPKKAA